MTGKWRIRESLMLAGAVVLSWTVVGTVCYRKGGLDTGIKATRDSLAVVVQEKAVIQKQRDSIGAELVVAEKKSVATRTVYVASKNDVKVVGDSAYDSTGHFIQVLDPRITRRIVSADAHVVSLESQLRAQKFALRVDTVFIAKQAEETRLNHNIATMVKGSRLSRGVQVGVGMCFSQSGKAPCLYVGYGGEIKLP